MKYKKIGQYRVDLEDEEVSFTFLFCKNIFNVYLKDENFNSTSTEPCGNRIRTTVKSGYLRGLTYEANTKEVDKRWLKEEYNNGVYYCSLITATNKIIVSFIPSEDTWLCAVFDVDGNIIASYVEGETRDNA